MGYKSELQGNNVDLQKILDTILALGLVDIQPEADTLDGCSWANISVVAATGKAKNYFTVGDCKKITLNGTVGTLELSNFDTCVYIIGFDHNGATNTIDFGTFKTADSNRKDICLVDSYYNNNGADVKGFSLGRTMYDYFAGIGWKDCPSRYDVLGSTNVIGVDIADVTTTTNPVNETLMAALPSDLREVMKPMTIYTDNAGHNSDISDNVTSTVDYLPLLAEYEVIGFRSCANSGEQDYQMQYAYYSYGNSRVKFNHNETNSAVMWILRSPAISFGAGYSCIVNDQGACSLDMNVRPRGLAPIFRV